MSKKLFLVIFYVIQACFVTGLVLVICNWSAGHASKAYTIGQMVQSICALVLVLMAHFKKKLAKDTEN